MKATTLMDMGRHAGHKADESVRLVADLVDDMDEKAIVQTYAATILLATLVAQVAHAERRRGQLTVDEAFVRDVMSQVTDIVVNGVLLGEKRLGEKRRLEAERRS